MNIQHPISNCQLPTESNLDIGHSLLDIGYSKFIYLLPAIFFLVLGSPLSAADVVPAGKGSYASAPPGEKEVNELFAKKPNLEPEVATLPLPTNDWWTTQLMEAWPGKMWATPATISANGAGVRIWYPVGWNQGGTEMEQGEPLEVVAVNRGPAAPDADIVICDFEFDAWPADWKVTGTGWGKGPVVNANARDKANGIAGQRYANSFPAEGDRGQGDILSSPFTIQRDYISILVGGGGDGKKARIALEIDGKEIYSESGKNSWDFSSRLWDVKAYKGKPARIHLIDQTGGGWGWVAVDQVVQTNSSQPASAGLFKSCSTKSWGDWTQVMRLRTEPEKYIDATYGHGLPYVWIESKNVDLSVPGTADAMTDAAGKAVKLPYTGDALVLARGPRTFALFAPEKTEFVQVGGGIDLKFSGKDRFVVVALLPDAKSAPVFQKYAYAVPRDTKLTYKYERDVGEVVTTWTITADALRGTSREVLQGWLPHHYRTTRQKLPFVEPAFATLRGKMRLAPGNTFEIAWPFKGLLPVMPAPKVVEGLPNPYQPARMAEFIQKWTAEKSGKKYGDDTYWGAKDFLVMAEMMAMSRQLKLPEADKLHEMTKTCLTDWLTYTPGENAHYFAKYPLPWSGLVGFKTSYGSGGFTDNHFHYGYFTLAGALLAMEDPKWGADFAPMLKMVAKQYANWDRKDKDFPWMRCFDPWNGHCYAGGGSNREDGNNQESSSESMGGWTGLFLLGCVLKDQDMIDAGAMGWAIESEAVAEYWNDYYAWKIGPEASNYSPNYKNKHSIVSVLRDRDIGYWTWFSGDAIHIYGIQWLPMWTSLQYLGKDPAFATWQVDNMLKAQGKGTPVTFSKLGDDWGNIAVGYAMFGDPARAAKILDEAYAANDKLGQFGRATLTYYYTHSLQSLGQIAWNCSTSIPTSTVFRDAKGKYTAVIYNSDSKDAQVGIFRDGKKIGTVTAPAGTLSRIPVNE